MPVKDGWKPATNNNSQINSLMNPDALLSFIIFAPAVGALLLAVLINDKNIEAIRMFSLGTTIVTFGATLLL